LNNLNEDAGQIKFILERRIATQAAVENLLEIMNTKPLDEKGIEKHIAQFLTFERFYPLNNAFEMMKSNGMVVENKNLRTTISRYYDFEQKKVAQSIKDIERVFIRIVQTENAIRSNLESSNLGTNKIASIKIKNTSDPNFLELLHTELVTFNDNNGTATVRISDFKNHNNHLITMIKKELDKRRLKKYL
jgi:arginine deiminase